MHVDVDNSRNVDAEFQTAKKSLLTNQNDGHIRVMLESYFKAFLQKNVYIQQ